MFKSDLTKVLAVLFFWRIFLFIIGGLATNFLPYDPSFPYAYTRLPLYSMPQWLYSWANFDGVHYLTIEQSGYKGTALIQAFFPLYPLLSRYLNFFVDNYLLTSLLVSNLAFLLTVTIFYLVVKKKFSALVAWKALGFILLFPTSFFFVAVYNESIFLLFVLISFYAAAQKKWLISGIFAALASATRIVGVVMVPALLLELFLTSENSKLTLFNSLLKKSQFVSAFKLLFLQLLAFVQKNAKAIASILLGLLGILSYMLYLQYEFNDPLYFFHVQSEFGSGREESVVLLPQVLWRALKIVITVPMGLRWWSYLQELLFTVFAFAVLVMGLKKYYKINRSWIVYSIFALLIPTFTGTLSSMPRYVLVAFPIFVILAQLQLPKFAWYLLYLTSAIALVLNTILFIQGYWIA